MSAIDFEVDGPERVRAPGSERADGPPSEGETWQPDKNGDLYIRRGGGRPGIIKRQGDETPEEARKRDAEASGKRPRPKTKRPKMPPATKKADLKQLEEELAGALKAPGAFAIGVGDEFLFNHFNTSGPYLARQLVLAAEHNPWLRKQLESMATGEDALMKVAAMFNVGGALFLYLTPPVVYLFNIPIPERGRRMMNIPNRPERTPSYAATAPGPESAPNGDQPATGA